MISITNSPFKKVINPHPFVKAKLSGLRSRIWRSLLSQQSLVFLSEMMLVFLSGAERNEESNFSLLIVFISFTIVQEDRLLIISFSAELQGQQHHPLKLLTLQEISIK